MDQIRGILSESGSGTEDGRVDFGRVLYAPGGSCGPRTQRNFQVVALLEGGCDLDLDGSRLRIRAGEVAVLHPGGHEHFHFSPDRPTHHTWIHLRPDFVDGAGLRPALVSLPRILPLTGRIRSLVDTGVAMPRHGFSGALGPLAACIVLTLTAEISPGQRGTGLPAPLVLACEFAERRHADAIGLADLARAAGVTPHHLIRLFRRHLGITPSRHLWRLRVGRGLQLLRETGLTIEAIAAQSGFQSPFHFSRKVREATGLPPSAIRRDARRGPG